MESHKMVQIPSHQPVVVIHNWMIWGTPMTDIPTGSGGLSTHEIAIAVLAAGNIIELPSGYD